MECKFSVGQKVVCVDDSDGKNHWCVPTIGGMDGLTKGRLYTVREVYLDPVWDEPLVRLDEITRPPNRYKGEPFEVGYSPSRFRPVTTRKTDISQFQRMLTSTKVEERA